VSAPRRRARVLLAGLVLGVLGLFALPASPAAAHAALVRTQPVQGTVVPEAPKEIVVTFSEAVEPVKDKIKVIGPDGKQYQQGTPTVSGSALHIPVRLSVPQGTYVVGYRVISADGHPVGAAFTYSVGAPSTNNADATAAGSSRTDPVVAWAVSIADFLGFAGLVLAVGPALVLLALWPRRLDRRGPTRLGYAGLGLVGLATLLDLYLEAPYTAGTGLFGIGGGDLGAVLDSRFGWAHLARLGLLAIVAVLMRPVLAGRGTAWQRYPLLVAAVAGLATWGISGHPGTSTAPALTVVADAAHLGGVAVWIGGLVVLFGFLLRRANPRELGAILPVWSDWATAAVITLVLAGTAQALVEIGSVDALLHTRYGVLVLVKVGLLVAILAVATVSRRLVRRSAPATTDETATDDTATDEVAPDEVATAPGGGTALATAAPASTMVATARALRRTVLIEVIGAVIVIGVAAALVQTTPARTQAAVNSPGTTNGIYSATMTSSLYQLQFDIEPAQTGPNDIHLYAYTPQGAPLKVLEWKVTAALPAQGIEPIEAVLTPITDSHDVGQVTLPAAGQWQFSFTLRTTEIDEATVTTTVKINQ
jgi:copper transport protein